MGAESVVDRGEETAFADAGIVRSTDAASASGTGPSMCMVCMDELTDSRQWRALGCGHRFCNDCWRGHLRAKVLDEGRACHIPCMAHGCRAICDTPCAPM